MAEAVPAVLLGFVYDPAHNLWRCDEAGLYVTATDGRAALYRDNQDEPIAAGPWHHVAVAAEVAASGALLNRLLARLLAEPRFSSDHLLIMADAFAEYAAARTEAGDVVTARAVHALITQLRDAAPSRAAVQTVPTPQP